MFCVLSSCHQLHQNDKKANKIILCMITPNGAFCCFYWSPTQTSGWVQMESVGGDLSSIRFETPSLSYVNHRWTQYGWKWTKSKKERKRVLGCSTVFLSWWCTWIEEIDMWMLKMCHIQIQPQIWICYIHVRSSCLFKFSSLLFMFSYFLDEYVFYWFYFVALQQFILIITCYL